MNQNSRDKCVIEIVRDILSSSIINLFKNQPDILEHTSQTTMTEWNLAHHLANEISRYIFWLNCDLEVRKRDYGERPDIIFHKRGINELNFLVIELKKTNRIENDIEKIKKHWIQGDLKYRLGAIIVIKAKNEWYLCVFDRDNTEKSLELKSENWNEKYYIPPIVNCFSPLPVEINQLVYELFSITRTIDYKTNLQKQDMIKKFEHKIEQLICRLYGF